MRPAASPACSAPFFLYCHGGNRGRVSRVACGWKTTAGCPARRQGCCCRGVGGAGLGGGGCTCHRYPAVIISFVSVAVDNGFCPRRLPRRQLVQFNSCIFQLGHFGRVLQRKSSVIQSAERPSSAKQQIILVWVCISQVDKTLAFWRSYRTPTSGAENA